MAFTMPAVLRTLLEPLNLAAFVTWLAVALSLRPEMATLTAPGAVWTLMLMFLLGFLAEQFVAARRYRVMALAHAGLAVIALAVVWLAPRNGTTPVLLVILMVQLARTWPAWTTIGAALVMNAALYIALRMGGHPVPGIVTLIFIGFEAFAALTAHYARSAEDARDRLARVNADLLATRALLGESARDAERLRVARELHDVAGHKLTAMRLLLRTMASDPGLSARDDVRLVEQLSVDLLAEIRGVVQAMRDGTGHDLQTALRALAAPFPRPALALEIADDVRIDDSAVADTLLRIVQEALTNAARHADADRLTVCLAREGAGLLLTIVDDGTLCGPLREGNGLAGMRERIDALGGRFTLARTDAGALRIDASLPG